MFIWPLLSIVIFSPLLGALAISFAKGREEVVARNARNTAFFTTIISFIFSILVWIKFDVDNASVQLTNYLSILPNFFLNYNVGIDGISLFFVISTSLLGTLCVASTWLTYTPRIKEFMVSFLILESMVLGAFASQNLMLFFLFFEGALLPLFIMIGVWGGETAKNSAFRFAVGAIVGSMIMLPALLIVIFRSGTGYIPDLGTMNFSGEILNLIWWALFIGFAFRLPIVPLHSWYTHLLNHAPIPVTAFVVGAVTKLGMYGMLRVNIGIFPYAASDFSMTAIVILFISSLYAISNALVTQDLKKAIGYVAMASMNLIVVGIFILTYRSITGAVFLSILYGTTSAGLLIIVAILNQRFGEIPINNMGGVLLKTPFISSAFLVLALTVAGMPFTGGFVGLLISLTSAFEAMPIIGIVMAILFVLIGVTFLNIHRKVFWGSINEDLKKNVKDANVWERALILSILLMVFITGVFPMILLKPIEQTVWSIVVNFSGIGN